MIKREVMLLPINGYREDGIRVLSLENANGENVGGYEVTGATWSTSQRFPEPVPAFDWAFQCASWNARVVRRFT